jgi:hypothetical protein
MARGMLLAGGADQHMAGLVGTMRLAGLTRLAAEAGAAEGDPRPVYTWEGTAGSELSLVRSYLPSDGGPPRLVADVGDKSVLGVWEIGTGAFLGALQGPGPPWQVAFASLVTYQRSSDGRPRIAAGLNAGHLCIWDGDDLQVLHIIMTNPALRAPLDCLAVYEEPTSGRTRLVTG